MALFFSLANCVYILSTKCDSIASCPATFSFYVSTANVIGSPANCYETICSFALIQVLMLYLLYCRLCAALLSRTVPGLL